MNLCSLCQEPCADDAVFCDGCQPTVQHRLPRERAAVQEDDPWIGQADPLEMRRLPTSVEVAPIEEEDTRYALAPGKTSIIYGFSAPRQLPAVVSRPATKRRPLIPARVHLSFILLAVMLVLALIVDGVLILLHVTGHASHNVAHRPPMLSITPGTARLGQVVLLHINKFSSSAHVLLTRDIQEAVRTDAGYSFIKLDANGSAAVRIWVQDRWGPGFHMIVAEDTTTHYTASATLQVVSDSPVPPPHLLVTLPGDSHSFTGMLNFGASMQDANTLRSLLLRNMGEGWIYWQAVSNRPWLMISPPQGIFQESQGIFIAVSRANLAPGDYKGAITFRSNTGAPLSIHVEMSVLPLRAAASAFMALLPPLLPFSATDGGRDPASQPLTISNPGARPLNWSLSAGIPSDFSNQNAYAQPDIHWLSTDSASGTVAPGASAKIKVVVHSRSLLPGVYSGLLIFTSGGDVLNAPQSVAISLTVQPRCGVATSLGSLAFTVVSGQSAASDQVLDLGTTPGCPDATDWQGSPLPSWLSITPASGQLQPDVNTMTIVRVNASTLAPGSYNGFIDFLSDLRSQTVMVQVTVLSPSSTGGQQPTVTSSLPAGTPFPGSSSTPGPGTPTPSPGAPVLGVSPLSLQFTATAGQNNPPGQSVTISNTGGGQLYWQAGVSQSASSWLSVVPAGGTTAASQIIQVNANSAGLAPGTYNAQITVTATDRAGMQVQGSPQTVAVALTVQQPCSLQVTPSNLTFVATVLQPNPSPQSITLKETGNCLRPVSWTASVDPNSQNWLILSAPSGTDSGNGSTIVVDVSTRGKLVGKYTGQITLSAADRSGVVAQGSPQIVTVTLTVIG